MMYKTSVKLAVVMIMIAVTFAVVMDTGRSLVMNLDNLFSNTLIEVNEFRSTYFSLFNDLLQTLEYDRERLKGADVSTSFRYTVVDASGKKITGNEPYGSDLDTYYSGEFALLVSEEEMTYSDYDAVGTYYHFGNWDNQLRATTLDWKIERPVKIYMKVSPISDKGEIGRIYRQFTYFKARQTSVIANLIAYVLIWFLSLAFLNVVAGQKHPHGEVESKGLDRVPFEWLTILFGTLSITPLVFIVNLIEVESFPLVAVAVVFSMLMFVIFELSLARRIKSRTFWRSWFIYWLFKKVFNLFDRMTWKRIFKPSWIFYLNGLLMINILAAYLLVTEDVGVLAMFLTLTLNTIATVKLYQHLESVKIIDQFIENQSFGNLEEQITVGDIKATFLPIAQRLNTLNEGMKLSVEKAVKSEKLKTELITNVTHDLKNPLTSIVAYTDLLAKEDLDNETAGKYVGILQDKAQRLNHLINQLVEASKVNSGHIEVNETTLDLLELVHQVSGEYEEQAHAAGIDLIVNTTLSSASITSDPVLLHRIFDNLLSNITKYTMQGTRVYINLKKENHLFEVELKNISKEPLNMPVEELLQRFTRGEEARSTAGNGLGLSIAMSLSKVLQADMRLSIDGDMFKVVLNLA
ncbi:sensor histidine kinase [Fusibacter sp. A1]|nr:sensor histidine kinase [Fusibacter sp. A1]